MFWKNPKNEKEVLEIIDGVSKGKVLTLVSNPKADYEIMNNEVIILREATWTVKYSEIHKSKLIAIDILCNRLEESYDSRQDLFCIDCAHSSCDIDECNHPVNSKMDLVNGTITDHLRDIKGMRNFECQGFLFKAKNQAIEVN